MKEVLRMGNLCSALHRRETVLESRVVILKESASRFLNFGPKKILQAPQNGSFHFWKNLKKRHILCYDSKMMSKIENLLADSSA